MKSIKEILADKENKNVDEEIEFECPLCEDTGEIPCDEPDGEGHWQSGTGSKPCECQG